MNDFYFIEFLIYSLDGCVSCVVMKNAIRKAISIMRFNDFKIPMAFKFKETFIEKGVRIKQLIDIKIDDFPTTIVYCNDKEVLRYSSTRAAVSIIQDLLEATGNEQLYKNRDNSSV